MSRSGSYQWAGHCPGDLYSKGYFCEAAFKVHGSSGLHSILLEVMKRRRLATEFFKNKNFQENNLVQVREAVRDVCKSYGIAAALVFAESDSFPSQQELRGVEDVSALPLENLRIGSQNHPKQMLHFNIGQLHFLSMVQFRSYMMLQQFMVMAMRVNCVPKPVANLGSTWNQELLHRSVPSCSEFRCQVATGNKKNVAAKLLCEPQLKERP